ncbi:MAG TPA: TlpA disulfide reductase family protein [Mucilaginibacter sp.]
MRPKHLILFLLCITYVTVDAQKTVTPVYNLKGFQPKLTVGEKIIPGRKLGDPRPKLTVREWIKRSPGDKSKNIEVVEFWATWCGPCISNMSHLSELALKYKDSVSFSAINVYEARANFPKSDAQVKAFVAKMGNKMNLDVALVDSNAVHDWLDAYRLKMIPAAFIIDQKNRVAWVGHPMDLDTVLPKVLDKTWDIEKELSLRHEDERLKNLDTSIISKVRPFVEKSVNLGNLGLPDSVLNVIDRMVNLEPGLEYMPTIVKYKFSALLKLNTQRAFEFGQKAMAFARYKESVRLFILDDIRDDARKFTTPKEIYLLGAQCLQEGIDGYRHPLNVGVAENYHEMADWYRKAGEKGKAIAAEEKAIEYWKKDLSDDLSKIDDPALVGLATNLKY